MPQIVTACVETGLGMVQLACPEEQAWGGVLKRRLLLVYGSNTWLPGPLRRLLLPVAVAYTKVRYRRQARRVTRQIADYQRGGIAVVGVIGVDGSPSCGLNRTLDIPRAVERLATTDPDSLTTSQMNSIVTDSLRPGPGLFTGALQRRLARTGHPVTYLAHDLPAELRGEPPTVAAALRTLSTGLSALSVGCRRRDGTQVGDQLTTTTHDRAGTQAAVALRCDHLTRRFGDRVAVDDVSLTVQRGQTYGLLGPNGAGKTTTIRMVCGLLRRDGGEVAIAGHVMDGSGSASARALIGYVQQDIALYPDLTARENLRFFGRLYRLGARELTSRVDEVLELVDLRERGDDRVESFSGGMKRRLNIAAGLVHRPTLLVLDEPTVGVDPQSRHAILEAVRSFGALGMAVLYTTHYMEEAERLCDRIGIIDHGRLIAEGTLRDLVGLVRERDRIELVATGDLDSFAAACRAVPGVDGASVADGQLHVLAPEGRRALPAVLEAAERSGAVVRSVQVVEPDLEAVFLHLTGTALRE